MGEKSCSHRPFAFNVQEPTQPWVRFSGFWLVSFLAMCPPKLTFNILCPSPGPCSLCFSRPSSLATQPPSFLFLTQLCLLDKSSFMFNLMNQELCLLINRSCHIHPWGNFSLFPLAFQPGYSFSALHSGFPFLDQTHLIAPSPAPDITEKGSLRLPGVWCPAWSNRKGKKFSFGAISLSWELCERRECWQETPVQNHCSWKYRSSGHRITE